MCKSPLALSLLFAVGLLQAPAALAQDVTSLDELIAKMDEARGGAEAWAEVEDVKMNGKMKMGPMELPFALEMARPHNMRMEMNIQGMSYIQVLAGDTGWSINPMTGKTDAEPLGGDELKQAIDQADIDGALFGWKEKGHKAELLGKEDFQGTPVYKVKLVRKSGTEEVQYVDAENFVVIAGESEFTMQGQKISGKSTVGDYKEVDGKIVPHSLINEITLPTGPMRQEMTIESVSFNNDLDESRFGKPEAAKPAAQ